MFRHALVLLILSLIAVFWLGELGTFLAYLNKGYLALTHGLGVIIRGGHLASVVRNAIALTLVPIVVALIPGGIYWLMKRGVMPYLFDIAYGVWIIMLTVLIMHH